MFHNKSAKISHLKCIKALEKTVTTAYIYAQ
jgi:hypothetical protein